MWDLFRGSLGSLASREPWRAFLGEGRDALAVIGTIAERALEIALEIELRFEAVPCRSVDRSLGRGKSGCGRRGESCQKLVHRRHELGILDTLPDQSPPRCLLGGELVTQER